MDEGADQPGRGGVELDDEVLSACRAVDLFVDAFEDVLNLLVQFGAVGDDQDTRIAHVLANPARQPDHSQAFAAALRMPDNATLALPYAFLRRTHAEVLVGATELLHAPIEDDKVVNDLQQTLLLAELCQSAIQRILNGTVFFPA